MLEKGAPPNLAGVYYVKKKEEERKEKVPWLEKGNVARSVKLSENQCLKLRVT